MTSVADSATWGNMTEVGRPGVVELQGVTMTLPGVGVGVLSFIVVSLNLLVNVTILTDRNLRHKTANLFLLSMSLSDFLIGAFVLPTILVIILDETYRFNARFCEISAAAGLALCHVSIYHIIVANLDRYLAITRPMQYMRTVSRRRVLYAVVSLWGSMLLLLFVMYNVGILNCKTFRFHPIMLGLIVIDFFCPLLIICCLYSHIYAVVRRHSSAIAHSQLLQGRSPDHICRRRRAHSLKFFRLVVVITVTFGLCWGPFFFTANPYLVDLVLDSGGPVAFFAGISAGLFNSALNPIIYFVFVPRFRVAFCKVILRRPSIQASGGMPVAL